MESLEADDPRFPCFPSFPWKLCSELPSFPRKSLDITEQNYTFMKSKFSWISWKISKKSLDFCSFSKLLKILGFLGFLGNFPRKIQGFPRNFQAFFVREISMHVYCFDIHGFKPSNKLTIKFVFHYHAMTSWFLTLQCNQNKHSLYIHSKP